MDTTNIKNGDTVYLHGREFIVTNIKYRGEGHLKVTTIDVTHLYKNHNDNLKALQLFDISPFSVSIK